ncbi:hypothetical protein [Streptomyces sp. 8L]|uniref:hypothetical protein n=1 Tax=Streptomyces sp. 8L TaxID=2877242 RepID=UPI001CD3DE64|nr:hypothetical protein [Streptomyces sp. 8L]MCA1222357.1 hypothetical protein [Streptomyces sp. 8L]
MNGPHPGPGWCHWHHAPADGLALIAVAPAVGGRDLYACTECRTTYRLSSAADSPLPEDRHATPCVAGGHDFRVGDESGAAYRTERGAEVRRVAQRLCEPDPQLQALARATGETKADD